MSGARLFCFVLFCGTGLAAHACMHMRVGGEEASGA